jgi:hypothetical protein
MYAVATHKPLHHRSVSTWHDAPFIAAETDANNCIMANVILISLSFIDVHGQSKLYASS